MFAFAIDRADQLCNCHVALDRDLFQLFQNSSSRLTLVLWPAMTIERFETEDFSLLPRK